MEMELNGCSEGRREAMFVGAMADKGIGFPAKQLNKIVQQMVIVEEISVN